MKKKQVLALFLSVMMIAGNVTTVSAIDFVKKDSWFLGAEMQGTEEEVPLESIEIDPSSLTLAGNGKQKLDVIFQPSNTTVDRSIKWKIAKNGEGYDPVIEMSNDGVVYAVSSGTAKIKAKVAGKTAVCDVTVNGDEEIPLESIQLDKTEIHGKEGKTEDIQVSFNQDNSIHEDVEWSTSDEDVATVKEKGYRGDKGRITLVGEGTAIITAKAGEETAKCEVTVVEKDIDLESISLNKTSISGKVGDTEKLEVSYNPDNTTVDKTVNWSTSDEKVAAVDKDGNVELAGEGKATITAEVAGKTATCEVTVGKKEIALESISLNKTSISGKVGDKEKLEVSYNPDNTTVDKTVDWSTSDEKVAAVDKDGNVELAGEGKATITAEVAGKTATCEVTVGKKEIALESISLNKTSISGKVGDTEKLEVSYNPDNTTVDKTVNWSTSDEKVAAVDKDGNVKLAGEGKATITAEVAGKTATCEVTVGKKEIVLESISLNKTSISGKVGDKEKLEVLYNPDNTTVDKTVNWSTSNAQVAYVDSKGNVKMDSEGTATITAEVAGKTATCEVTVGKKEIALESIKLNKTSVKGEVEDTEKLVVSYNPNNTTVDRTVEWSTSDAKVATVDKEGNVELVGEGSATITAEVAGKTATCEVIVGKKEIALESIKLDKTSVKGEVGDTEKLTVLYNPDNTTVDKTVKWSTSDEKVAAVDKEGNVELVGEGSATITAEAAGKTAACDVTVSEKKLVVESIKLDKEEAKLKKGDSLKLNAEVKANKEIDVVWTSSNESIATVDKNGNVKALASGTVTITATAGDKTATCTITVTDTTEKPDNSGNNNTENSKKPTTKPNSDKSGAVPKTGDSAMLGFWGIILVLSAGLIVKLRLGKKKKDSDNE